MAEVNDSTMLAQLGTPIVDVATGNGVSLMYGAVEEIGNHMPEARLNRDVEIIDVALNG